MNFKRAQIALFFCRESWIFMDEMVRRITKTEEIVIQEEVKTVIKEEQAEHVEYAFVFDAFFNRHFNDPEEVLDKNKSKEDRERRVYVCLKFIWDGNTFLLPLRNDLKNLPQNPKLKKACYPVPSDKRPNAGLDFRKLIIINDDSLYRIDKAEISQKQRNCIQDNFAEIKTMAIEYIEGFKKSAKKKRQKRDALYKYSALNNFLNELKI